MTFKKVTFARTVMPASEVSAIGANINVAPQRSALELFGKLRPRKKFSGRRSERKAVARAVSKHTAKNDSE
jgi:FAD synthase